MWVDFFSLDFYRATMTQPYVTRFVHADTLNCDFYDMLHHYALWLQKRYGSSDSKQDTLKISQIYDSTSSKFPTTS